MEYDVILPEGETDTTPARVEAPEELLARAELQAQYLHNIRRAILLSDRAQLRGQTKRNRKATNRKRGAAAKQSRKRNR